MERLALFLVLVLAPHTKFPAFDWVYPFRPADLVLLGSALIFLRWGGRSNRLFVATPEMFFVFILAMLSALWGGYLLDEINLDAVEVGDTLVPYFQVAAKKLMLIFICFIGFQWILSTTSQSNSKILKAWYLGLLIAVILHSLSYLVTADYFAVRAGVFMEGNHGGSYYLLSFFIMWFARQQGLNFGRGGMVVAFFGLILSQSTSALLFFFPLVIVTFFLLPTRLRNPMIRWRFIFVAGFSIAVLLAMFSDEIIAKIFGDELNSLSFSRFDRLASIASGMNMFYDHWIFGVGIQGYAFALPNYVDPFIEEFFDWNSRRIANNIYVEWLAEQGAIGAFAMLLLLYKIIKPVFSNFRKGAILVAGTVSIILSWLAFPSYTVSFHWIGFAVLVRLAKQSNIAPISVPFSMRKEVSTHRQTPLLSDAQANP